MWELTVTVFLIAGLALVVFLDQGKSKNEAMLTAVYVSLNERVQALAALHADTLARKRRQGIRVDDYGNPITAPWVADVQYFYDNVVLSDIEFRNLNYRSILLQRAVGKPVRNHDGWLRVMYELIDEVVSRVPVIAFGDIHTGEEYEVLCESLLKSAGWDVRRTGKSGDQGVDLVAEKNRLRVALQCKLYSSPVGNAAVQEVIAGKTFAEAHFAVVVSNATYTPAAKQLASVAGVYLLHHEQLITIDEIVGRLESFSS